MANCGHLPAFSQIDKAIGWEYDSGENVLRVNMPQALLQPHYRGR